MNPRFDNRESLFDSLQTTFHTIKARQNKPRKIIFIKKRDCPTYGYKKLVVIAQDIIFPISKNLARNHLESTLSYKYSRRLAPKNIIGPFHPLLVRTNRNSTNLELDGRSTLLNYTVRLCC